jgi:hypothetical protein
MSDVIGHWKNLTEAQKLTQSKLIPGVIEQDIKLNNPIERFAVALALGKSITWNREKTVVDGDVSVAAIGQKTTWTDSVDYDQMDRELKIVTISRVLNHYIQSIYGTINNYRSQQLWEIKKGVSRKMGDLCIYGDTTYSGGSLEPDGLHAWAAENDSAAAADGVYDIDMASAALSVGKLRQLLSVMKQGCDGILIPTCLGIRIDAAYEEAGFARLASGTSGTMKGFTRGIDDIGKPIMYFDGVPLIRTDYLVAEQADTGRGTTARGKFATGTKVYSLFGFKSGDVFNGEPGITLGFGNPDMMNKLYMVEYFPQLEDYIAEGIRLTSYFNLLLGSKLCLTRIHDITDAEIVY